MMTLGNCMRRLSFREKNACHPGRSEGPRKPPPTRLALHHRTLLCRCAAFTMTAGFGAWLALQFVPIPLALSRAPEPSVEFTDRNGAPLRKLLVDNTRFADVVPLDQVPQSLIDATVCAEDKRFW